MDYEERRRRRRYNIVITEWRGKLKSKQQIEEDIENVIKENIEEAKVEDCYNINKDQVPTSENGGVEWKRESDETKGKIKSKYENREDIHRQ
jgi:hypothetical protein